MNHIRTLCAIFALLASALSVSANVTNSIGVKLDTDSGYEVYRPKPQRAGVVTSQGYNVTLNGVTLAPHSSDPAHTAWATETVGNPSGVTYLTSIKPEDLVWTGNPDPVTRFPGQIIKNPGTFILDNVRGYLRVPGHDSDLGLGILVRITRFSQGTVGWNGDQRITSGPMSQELTRLDLSGFGVWLEALSAAEETSALQSLRSLPAGTLITYGYEVEDVLFTQTVALEVTPVTPVDVAATFTQTGDTLHLTTVPAGRTVTVQMATALGGQWVDVGQLSHGGSMPTSGNTRFYRAKP